MSKTHLLWRTEWLALKLPAEVKLMISCPDRKLTSWNKQRRHDAKQWVGTFSCPDRDQCNEELFLSGCPSACPFSFSRFPKFFLNIFECLAVELFRRNWTRTFSSSTVWKGSSTVDLHSSTVANKNTSQLFSKYKLYLLN